MPEIMILFGTCLVCGVAGAIFKLQDWADERKARHIEQIKRMRECRRKAPRAREKECFWEA